MNLRLQPGLSLGSSYSMVGRHSSLLGGESLLDQCCYCRDAMAPASLPNGVWSAPGAKCLRRRAKMPSPVPPQEVEERLLVLGQRSGQSSGQSSAVQSLKQRLEPESRLMLKTTLRAGVRRQQKRTQEQRRRQSQGNLRRRSPRSALRRREGGEMPEGRGQEEGARFEKLGARQASDEDQDLRFTDSGVYGEGVEPCQDTRVADGSRPTRGLVQTRSRWPDERGWMMGWVWAERASRRR